VDIAVTKNGYSNLDVKTIWTGTAATRSNAEVTQPDTSPVAGLVDSRVS
jgi:hypothetical protein